jgi:hypothetical protein
VTNQLTGWHEFFTQGNENTSFTANGERQTSFAKRAFFCRTLPRPTLIPLETNKIPIGTGTTE